mmetsp:Transcript_13005/g.24821  ORF Transcript_13005/g.24821 Transcript_13005/m.24821 type:complete len:89 (-) Transcript_13005:64-330(-)
MSESQNIGNNSTTIHIVVSLPLPRGNIIKPHLQEGKSTQGLQRRHGSNSMSSHFSTTMATTTTLAAVRPGTSSRSNNSSRRNNVQVER